jgi:hypothetical protein
VPVRGLNAKPRAETVEVVVGEAGCGEPRELPHIERARRPPRQTGQIMLAPQHREIVANRVTDHHGGTQEVRERRRDRGKARRILHARIGDAVDGGRHRGNRNAGIDETFEAFAVVDVGAGNADCANLHQPRGSRIEGRRFGVEHDGIERKQKRCADGQGHR